MSESWSSAPFVIQVNGDPTAQILAASAGGALVLRWSLAGLNNQGELDASAAEVFEFPFKSASAAGLVDMLSDLEWMPVQNGVFLVLDATAARGLVVKIVAGLLPGIVDRWRSGTVPFEVFLIGVEDTSAVAEVLARRRCEIGRLLALMPDAARQALATGLATFAEAAWSAGVRPVAPSGMGW